MNVFAASFVSSTLKVYIKLQLFYKIKSIHIKVKKITKLTA